MSRPQRSRGASSRDLWAELPVAVAEVLRPNLDGIATDMIDAIRREVPSYRRPLDSELGRDLVAAVRRALYHFVELVENPNGSQEHTIAFFRRLGKAEFLTGRGMDELQAAYRVGARVGCRRYTEIAQAASLPIDTVLLLSEAVLVHINALANQSVTGYSEARARSIGDARNKRLMLAERLLERTPDPSGTPTESLAVQAEWALPDTVACLVVESVEDAVVDRDILVLPRGRETVLVVPDPGAAGRVDRLRTAVRSLPAALGPAVPPQDAWLSAQCAWAALRYARRGLFGTDDLVFADRHLGDLVLLGSEHISRLLAGHTLDALGALPAAKASRMEETLHALLSSANRTAPEVAAILGLHPQTARYRLRQLESLLGDRLADPVFRFEAELVLRTRSLHRAAAEEAT